MPVELSYLVSAVILYGVMVLFQALLANLQHSPRYLAGSRDGLETREEGAMLCRARRANQNMVEALLLFAPLVLVAHATDRLNYMTELGAGLFLGARIAYAPIYWLGVPWLRSLVWLAGVIGTVMVLLQVLPFSVAQ